MGRIKMFPGKKIDGLIGSYWSSFTDIAADMKGIEKVIAGEA